MDLPGISREALEDRLQEAKRTYKLNLGYAGLTQLPVALLDVVRNYNPNLTDLELSSNSITELPDELEQLPYLRTLRLKYNQLRRLPPVVGRLPQLMVLELAGNQITRLEGSVVAGLSLLKELDLSGNGLAELPASIGTLPKLEVLHLANNRLDSLPDTFGDLPCLTKLDISTNNLRFLPASMGRLRKVQRIDAANNMLVRVPPSMGQLKVLKELNLRYNNLDERYKSKAEEGLSRLLAFLREEEERERLEEIERLKPIGTQVGAYTEYRCKAEVGQTVRLEFGKFTVDNRCWIRGGHTLTQVDNALYVFGGCVVKDGPGTATADLYWMTLDRMEWHQQPTAGDKPCPRYGHCMVYDPEHHQLVLFGGRTAEKKRLNDVYVLSLDSYMWSKPHVQGEAPTPREGAAAVYHAGHVLLFGGHAAGARTCDLFMLELSSRSVTWSKPETTGTGPSPRSGAAMTVANGHYLVLHGGRNNFMLDDLHVLDLIGRTWLDVNVGGSTPPPRHNHLLAAHNETLYLFGGQDELGANSFALFRLSIPRVSANTTAAAAAAAASAAAAGEDAAAGGAAGLGTGSGLRGSWLEIEAELPYNKARSVVMHKGTLSMFQLGSMTLGRTNDDEAEKGQVFWDVFKTAKLDNLRPKAIQKADALASGGAGKSGRVQHATHTAAKLPASFTSNSAKEGRLLAYVGDFKRVFEELYPHRRPLFLTPPNECGIPKFVCSTLRASQLPFTELYELAGAAQFVADFLVYEPLESPLHPPAALPSPASVLAWQAGDSFDFAVVLASLLLGAGFNTYVVAGYAPLALTLNDHTGDVCPLQEATATPGAARATAAPTPGTSTSASSGSGHDGSATARSRPLSSAQGQRQQQGQKGAAADKAADAAAAQPRYVIKTKPKLDSRYEASMAAESAKQDQQQQQQQQQEDTQRAAAAAEAAAAASGPAGEEAADADVDAAAAGEAAAVRLEGPSKRMHAWVLVLPGRREVTEPIFIEPTTGQRYSPEASPYEGVEWVWNNANFWVCMQQPEPHSDARAHPANVSWELSDATKWEAVFEDKARHAWHTHQPSSSHWQQQPQQQLDDSDSLRRAPSSSMLPGISNMRRGSSVAATLNLARGSSGIPPPTPGQLGHNNTMRGRQSMAPVGPSAGPAPPTPNNGVRGSTSGAPVEGAPPSRGGQGSRSEIGERSDPMRHGPESEYARSEYGAESVVTADEEGGSDGVDVVPDLPPSWVPKLSIARDSFDMRCPRGARTMLFKRSELEIFARFGECAPWNGLTERLTVYADDARSVVCEVREWFSRRKDKLLERRSYPKEECTMELFAPGSHFSVKELVSVRGACPRRTITFYHAARLDGLLRREERIGTKITEAFVARSDRLEYRSATFGPANGAMAARADGGEVAHAAGDRSHAARDMSTAGAPSSSHLLHSNSHDHGSPGSAADNKALPVVKMTEKFARNPALPADADVAKRVYYVAAGKTLVQYHYGEGRVTASFRTFQKDGPAQAVQIDPLAPKPTAAEMLEQLQALLAAEKECTQAVRDSEWEGREIARSRVAQEQQSSMLVTPYYDICRVQAEDSDDEPAEAETSTYDYLSPFLPVGLGAGSLTRDQALDVRERCLRALKDRLIERANLIQARLDDEQAALSRRHANYARDREQLTPEEEEEHERAVEEAVFRVGILERRLQRHEAAALSKYYELDRQLRTDARLSMLMAPA